MDRESPTEPPAEDGRPAWERRIVAAEINGRRVNEAIQRGSDAGARTAVFMCECGRLGCTTKLELSLEEYDRVRASFERFLVAPGHEVPGIDAVAEDHDDYLVAVKSGAAADVAEETDPRT